eukprot:3835103-Pyramimonas_sp.AAC.1
MTDQSSGLLTRSPRGTSPFRLARISTRFMLLICQSDARSEGIYIYSHDGPIRRKKRRYILTADQSDARRAGIFSRRTNQTQEAQEARVYSHDGPIRCRKRGYILTIGFAAAVKVGLDTGHSKIDRKDLIQPPSHSRANQSNVNARNILPREPIV